MKKFWLKFKKWILFVLGFGVITTAVIVGAPGDTTTIADVQTKYEQATEIKAKYQLSEVSLIKTDIKNAELDAYKGEPKDEVKITIGDNLPVGTFGADAEFKPNIELKRWNEVSFKIKTDNLLKDVATKDKSLKFEGDKIKFDTPKISFEMYDYTEGEGGFKYIWYLNEKPATNKVEFQIESSGLDFFYQPPLTQEYQNGYSEQFQKEIVVTETQVKNLEGNVLAERPENVVGSYAVYHSTKGGMVDAYGKDYKTGKAFHIYRPHIIDAEGKECWGNLHIENGIYSVEIPQDFLDNAVYPIKSNDTFGTNTYGETTRGEVSNALYITYEITSPANLGTITKTTLYFRSQYATAYLKPIIVNSSKIIVANGVGSQTTVSTTTANWNDLNYSTAPTLAASTICRLGHISTNLGDNAVFYFDGASANYTQHDTSNSYATPTDPTDAADNYAGDMSIYATYTPSGGAAAAEDPPIIIIVD